MSFDYGITLLIHNVSTRLLTGTAPGLQVKKSAAHWWGIQRHFCVRMSYRYGSWADRLQQK